MSDLLQKFIDAFRAAGEALIVIVPKNITTKQQLLNSLGSQLRFPDHFGKNWDAFDDCIDDLGWIDEKNIFIIHEGFPQIPEKDFNVYCASIKEASNFWKQDGNKNLTIVFL